MTRRIPGWLNEVQFIKFWAMQDCNPPFFLYIETAKPIANEIAVQLLLFDFASFVKTLIRPGRSRQGRHGRRGRKDGRDRRRKLSWRDSVKRGIPEPADLVADLIDPDRDARPTTYSFGTKTLFVFSDIWERAAYTLFLYDAVDRLFWGSLFGVVFHEDKVCENVGRFAAYTDNHRLTPLVGWSAIGYKEREFSIGYASTTGFGAQPLWGKHMFIFSAMWTNDSTNDETMVGMMRFLVNGDPREPVSVELDVGASKPIIDSVELNAGDNVQWQILQSNGNLSFLSEVQFMGLQVAE